MSAAEPALDPSLEPGAVDPADIPGGLRAAVEAVLMVAEEPVPLPVLAGALAVPVPEVEATVTALRKEYDADLRGFELRETDAGWRVWSRLELAAVVRKFVAEATPSRLSRAALETLAIIAYRQPVARSTIASIRGVSADAVLRTLQMRGLVAEVGSDPATGAVLFGATTELYERLGLTGPDDLPPLAPFLPELSGDREGSR